MKQLRLLAGLPRSRHRRKLMHVVDAGYGEDLRCRFKCAWCGYATGWVTVSSVTEAKRGIPCEKCNP